MKSALRQFCATMLTLEAMVVFFGTLVLHGLNELPRGPLWAVGGVLMVLLILVAGMLRYRWAYWVGSALQVGMVLTGLILPMMYIVGGIFTLLWIASLVMGKKIDRERAQRMLAEADPEQVESES